MAQRFKTPITVEGAAAASSQAVAAKVDGDTQNRVQIDAGGKITWGDGSSAGDANLYRSAADALKTDDTLEAASGLITLTTSGAPTASLSDGALAIDTTNNEFYIRSGGAWIKQGGGGATQSDTAPSNPVAGDLWYETDTGAMYVYYDSAWIEVGTAGVIAMSTTSTPPSSPGNGDLWFDTDTAKTYVYYDDGTSTQWVEVGAASAAASGVDGAVQFASGGTFSSDDANLHWDDTNNRLGIGTTSPDRGLHVDSPTAAVSAKFTTQHASLGLVELADSSSTATSQIGTNGNDIVFRPIQSERMRIDSSGKVGIGTPSPNKPLHILYDDPTIQLTDTNTNADSIISANSSVGSLILGADENNEVGSSQIAFKVDGVTHMGLQSTGNLEMLGGTVKGDGALVQMVTSTSGSSDLTSSADIASITMSPKYSDSTMLVMVNYHAYKYNSTGAVNNSYNLYQFGGSSIRSNPYLVYDTPSYMFQGIVSGTIAAGSTASRTYYFNVTASSSADRIYFYWKTMYVLEIAT